MSPLWTLAPVSALAGALMMWVFRRTADRAALRKTVNRMQAHLLEFWLFVDEPSLVWKSWKGLLIANGRLLRLLVVPMVVLSIPMVPLFFVMDAFYGNALLPVGKPALVTVGMDQPLNRLPELTAPDGISVESPPVRVFQERQISWRIRPQRAITAKLRFVLDGRRTEKSVSAGQGTRFLSRKRTQSLIELIRYPTEAPLEAGPLDWIEVEYPGATVPLLGLEAHWSIWFLAFALAGALLSPR